MFFIPEWAIPWNCSSVSRLHWRYFLSSLLFLAIPALFPDQLRFVVSLVAYPHNLCHHFGLFQCPLCGGTSAFLHCSRLEFVAAVKDNAVAVLLWAWLCAQIALRPLAILRPDKEALSRLFCAMGRIESKCFLSLLIGYWAFLNILNVVKFIER